jgi:hypothetical protein
MHINWPPLGCLWRMSLSLPGYVLSVFRLLQMHDSNPVSSPMIKEGFNSLDKQIHIDDRVVARKVSVTCDSSNLEHQESGVENFTSTHH